MSTIMMSAFTFLSLSGFFDSPATAQSEVQKATDDCHTWTSVYDGKRSFKKYFCVEDEQPRMPDTVRIEVKAEDRQPGDIEGMKYVGKRTERVYFRDVERKAESASEAKCTGSKDGCNYMFITVGKHTERRSFCEHHNQRVMCGDKAGECGTCRS